MTRQFSFAAFAAVTLGCGTNPSTPLANDGQAALASGSALVLVRDVDLPGRANRFDYQDIDQTRGHLVITHMNDASVVVVGLQDRAVVKLLPNIPTPRGVVVADEAARIFVTSSPRQLVIIDADRLSEIARVPTGNGPDGVGWDPVHKTVGVSDQHDGAVSLIHDSGSGTRVQVPVGQETGNVVFDAARSTFWVTAVRASQPDQLVAIDPVTARVTTRIDLPGCDGAHGLRIHPDGKSALIACEGNDMLARVELEGAHAVVTAPTTSGPDVLGLDPNRGLLYVAAEGGDLGVFDLRQPGLVSLPAINVGRHAHSVAVDPATHRAFFPLEAGPHGTPVLRIMQPSGS